MQAIAPVAGPHASLVPGLHFDPGAWEEPEAQLRIKVLATHEQRQAIADLRKHAPMGVEDDLGAGLMPFEAKRDEVGVVTAFYRGSKLLATLRLVPSGQRLTAAECVQGGIGDPAGILGPGNWDVGRLIVAPEDRSPELLQRCLAMALQTLIEMREVEHFYAIATPVMARLWRRFGVHPTAPLCGASGRKFILVSGHVSEVAACLAVPLAGRDTLCGAQPQPVERVALAA
jgi:predicted GNAT family N-acyltransferase